MPGISAKTLPLCAVAEELVRSRPAIRVTRGIGVTRGFEVLILETSTQETPEPLTFAWGRACACSDGSIQFLSQELPGPELPESSAEPSEQGRAAQSLGRTRAGPPNPKALKPEA